MKGRVLALVMGVAPLAAVPAHGQDDEAAVRQVLVSYAEYVQSGNLEAIDTLWSPERSVHIIEGVGVNHGWVDYRDHHLKPELEAAENFRLEYAAIEPVVRGAVAWASFRSEVAADFPSGHVEAEGRGTAVLEKRDGRWVIVHLHTSSRRKEAESEQPGT